MRPYEWDSADAFVNREEDLSHLSDWWGGGSKDALALIGRRRVGKSWLIRHFADGKPALLLVADRRLASTQMRRFADQIEPLAGVRPDVPDLRSLFQIVYRLGREEPILVVIDEFPYLLPDGSERQTVLSELQAVMEEEREESKTKLILCGSLIGQMEALLAEESPLHGRLREIDVWPMTFAESAGLREAEKPVEQIARYAVAGGMARYLSELGAGGKLRDLVCGRVLDRRGPLFNDARGVLEQELRSPALAFSILEELATHSAQTAHLSKRLGLTSNDIWPTLHLLRRMRLLESSLPVGAPPNARSHRHRITDGFVRFWFRFVFPAQDDLEAELEPAQLWKSTIEPHLNDFVAPEFEDLCRRYTRRHYGDLAPRVGAWWGKALNVHRRSRSRLSEEVDIVGADRKRLRIAGECKWTTTPMPLRVLEDLRNFKLPAIAEKKRLRMPDEGPQILLFSRSGFSAALRAAARDDPAVSLIGVDELVAG